MATKAQLAVQNGRPGNLLDAQNRALEAVAGPAPLEEALESLTALVEEQAQRRAVAAIMLVSPDGSSLRSCVGPSLPAWYQEAVDGVHISDSVGTCAMAAACNKTVVTPDIEKAPSWGGLAHLPLSLGLRAAWSMPIVGSGGNVLGTFGTYFYEARKPTRRERRIVEGLCRTAALAIERRRSEDALREAEANKDRFLATLGHELRNPLAPLSAGVELLKSASNDPETLENVRLMMQRQMKHLVRLVDDLLDISRIGRGTVELKADRLDVNDILRAAVELTEPIINERAHELALRPAPEPLVVHGDADRLTQVVGNLLRNAAKFTEPGGRISVTASRDGDRVSIAVRDSGIGISAAQLDSIFTMFGQRKQPESNIDHGGLGIGLALSRELVTLHGGTLGAESEGPGRGSVFTVRLPVPASAGVESSQRVDAEAPAESLRIASRRKLRPGKSRTTSGERETASR